MPSNKLPLYSIPHFSLTMTIFPVSSFRNGFGLTGTAAWEILLDLERVEREREIDYDEFES